MLAFAGLLSWAVALTFADLRENPLFWRNVGGYPIWLREVVLTTFYPLFAFNLILLLSLTWHFFRRLASVGRLWWMNGILIMAGWGLMMVTGILVVANNVTNLLEGREFHSHEITTHW